MCRPCLVLRKLPKAPTPPPLPQASPEEKRAALKDFRSLSESLVRLENGLLHERDHTEGVKIICSDASQHLDNLRKYLSATIETATYNAIIPPHSTAAAQRTLAVPELFDMIMDYLPIPSILSFSQTCREYKARIDNSPHLQTALCLKAAPPDADFRTLFTSILAHLPGGGFCCKVPSFRRSNIRNLEEGTATVDIVAFFFPQGDEQCLPRIGSTYRRMFVTQPPLTELTPKIRCCHDLKVPVVRSTGITIGDLYDCAAETIEQHRWCPRETHGVRMFDNGQNQVHIEFTGKATVRASDHVVLKHMKERAQKEREDKRARWIRRMKSMYAAARRDALTNELPIPTMPEWLELHPEWRSQEVQEEVQLTQEGVPVLGDAMAVTIPVDAFSFN